jgi:phosphohistidine phosphatase SixA
MPRIALIIAACLMLSPAHATEAGWAQLREGGRVVLIRHANAPGTADPAAIGEEDCSARRNLSSRGQQQARRIGVLFAARAARTERVLSSRGCRSLETAQLAFGKSMVEAYEPLDPPSAAAEKDPAPMAQILEEIRSFSGNGNLVMVTDQSVIAELTGFSPREAEAVIVAPDEDRLHVTGRILFN